MEENSTVVIDETMLASKGKRLANYFIDLIMQYVVVFLAVFIVVIAAGLFGWIGLIEWFSTMNQFQELFLAVLIIIMYYGLMETLTQRTVGKFITGTIVVMEDGTKPDSRTILLRTFCRLIPFEAFSFLGDSGRGWHDTIMDTYVVDKKIYEEALRLKNSFEQIGTEEI